MKTLKISRELSLPLDSQTQTLVVYGGKGQGKTNFCAVFAEELVQQHGIVPHVLFEIAAGVFLHEGVGDFMKFFFRMQAQAHEVQEPFRCVMRGCGRIIFEYGIKSSFSFSQSRSAVFFFIGQTSFAQQRASGQVSRLVAPRR